MSIYKSANPDDLKQKKRPCPGCEAPLDITYSDRDSHRVEHIYSCTSCGETGIAGVEIQGEVSEETAIRLEKRGDRYPGRFKIGPVSALLTNQVVTGQIRVVKTSRGEITVDSPDGFTSSELSALAEHLSRPTIQTKVTDGKLELEKISAQTHHSRLK